MAERPLRIVDALREALEQEMATNRGVFLIGEDVRIGGGFSVSRGLVDRFGETRILDTPISEIAFTGLAIGAAMSGMRPIVEYQFGDFVFCEFLTFDKIVEERFQIVKVCHFLQNIAICLLENQAGVCLRSRIVLMKDPCAAGI